MRPDSACRADGIRTLEFLTETPFGIDRLDSVTFVVDRVLEVNNMLAGIEPPQHPKTRVFPCFRTAPN